MEELVLIKVVAYIGGALVMAIGTIAPAYAQGLVGSKACENIGKYPESSGSISQAMIMSLIAIETSAVYALLIALMLILFT